MNSSGLPALPGAMGLEMSSFSIPSLSENSICESGLSSAKKTWAWESILRYFNISSITFPTPGFLSVCSAKDVNWVPTAKADAEAAALTKNFLLFIPSFYVKYPRPVPYAEGGSGMFYVKTKRVTTLGLSVSSIMPTLAFNSSTLIYIRWVRKQRMFYIPCTYLKHMNYFRKSAMEIEKKHKNS